VSSCKPGNEILVIIPSLEFLYKLVNLSWQTLHNVLIVIYGKIFDVSNFPVTLVQCYSRNS
jgi:hypothetical protein